MDSYLHDDSTPSLPRSAVFNMLEIVEPLHGKMLRLTNSEDSRSRRWCAVIILVAVFALTVSVTTRYTLCRGISGTGTVTVQKHSAPELSRQRLLQNAAVWVPPVVSVLILHQPSLYARVVPTPPSISSLLRETSLYNRPPPSGLLFIS
jgi:hypothetical protein